VLEVSMTIYCRSCGLSNFRTSRFRFRPSDLSQLLLLRLPVRCLTCDERTYTSLSQFLKVKKARRERHRQKHGTI
jgi:hypothetical protein